MSRVPEGVFSNPSTFLEAVEELKKLEGNKICFLAGGTDVNVQKRAGVLSYDNIMDVSRIEGITVIKRGSFSPEKFLPGLAEDPCLKQNESHEKNENRVTGEMEFVCIGACVTMDDAATSKIVKELFVGLVEAALEVGSPQIRNMATLGGNVMNASPAGDVSTMLLALNTRVVLASPRGYRVLMLEKLFRGVSRTNARDDELLAFLLIPVPIGHAVSSFVKLKKRKALALSVVNAGARLETHENRISGFGLAIGAVAVTPLLVKDAENVLVGREISEAWKQIEKVCEIATNIAAPITDVRAGSDYRKEMVRVMTRRALEKALRDLARNDNNNGGE